MNTAKQWQQAKANVVTVFGFDAFCMFGILLPEALSIGHHFVDLHANGATCQCLSICNIFMY